MKKINYSKDESIRNAFYDEFYDIILNKTSFDVDALNTEIKQVDNSWDYKKLLTSEFSDLVDFARKAETQDTAVLNSNFKRVNSKGKYDYFHTDVQKDIAYFLSESELSIRSCPYCNIDFINPFNVFIEYNTVEEFIKYATSDEWEELLSEGKSQIIYQKIKKNKFTILDEIKNIPKIGKKTWEKINISEINNLKSIRDHFTLDHFLPKGKFPYLSVSVYNLIPSCYSCNSKFKGQRNFELSDFINSISPSSKFFCMNDHLNFKLNFDTKAKKFDEKIKNIKQIEDLEVNLRNLNSHTDVDMYIDMFKLKGRYNFHKDIAYELIEKRKRYPEKQIDEIVKIFRLNKIIVDKNDIKKDLFGKECFNSNGEPFEKYKQDIAKQLGII